MRRLAKGVALVLSVACVPAVAGAAPSEADFMRALERKLLQLVPAGFDERQVLFSNVRQGRASGSSFPFQADVVIRDYDSGYPPNGYFGQTCLRRMTEARFQLEPDAFGGWQVHGALTPRDSECRNNPAKDVSAIPLASVPGQRAAAAPAAGAPAAGTAPRLPAAPGALAMGEYACFGRSGPLAGLGFRLAADGRYTDLAGRGGGRYTHDGAAGVLAFIGGHMDGQSARRSGDPPSWRLSPMVSCEIWR